MAQKINIAILNSARRKQFTRIFRSSLKNYVKTNYIHNGRIVWAKPETLKKLFSRKNIGVKTEKGTTEITGKTFVRFQFSLWRKTIEDETDLNKLIILLKKRYDKVKGEAKKLPAQRIGISIGTADKEKKQFFYKATKRKRSKEVVDVISTTTYDRDKKSEEPMFEELKQKIREVFFEKKGYTLDLEGEDAILQAVKFFVFFTEA